MEGKLTIPEGVTALIASNNTPLPENAIPFEGDLCQMIEAAKVAIQLGIDTGMGEGKTCVYSEGAYEKVTQYMIDHRIDGYHHYLD